jgi:hypothetical protein
VRRASRETQDKRGEMGREQSMGLVGYISEFILKPWEARIEVGEE